MHSTDLHFFCKSWSASSSLCGRQWKPRMCGTSFFKRAATPPFFSRLTAAPSAPNLTALVFQLPRPASWNTELMTFWIPNRKTWKDIVNCCLQVTVPSYKPEKQPWRWIENYSTYILKKLNYFSLIRFWLFNIQSRMQKQTKGRILRMLLSKRISVFVIVFSLFSEGYKSDLSICNIRI